MCRKNHLIILMMLLMLISCFATAQRRKQQEERQSGRIEKFKTMRLIEILKLNEEEAARFTAKQRVHDDSMSSLIKERNTMIDAIDDLLRESGQHPDLDRKTADVLSVDQKIFNERLRYYAELEKLFTPEQFAKFIIFDRNFNRKLRDAMDELRNKFIESPHE